MTNTIYPTSSLTQIANLAFAILGHKSIRNIETDTQDYAKLSRTLIYDVIKEEQAGFYWPELKKRTQLSLAVEQPTDVTLTNYNIPTDFLQLIRMTDNSAFYYVGDYIQMEANSSTELPTMEYIKYDDDPSQWSTYLRECIYTKLAVFMAMSVAKDASVQQLATERYMKAQMGRNRAFKSAHSPIRRRRGTDWNRSRYSRSYNPYDRFGL